MAELSYIEHLNIPIKYRGSILHSYEYNATVNKINEIVDNLHVSYDHNKNFPKFDLIDDIFSLTSGGSPVLINTDEAGKLYPITSSAYVLIDTDTNLDSELERINSQITSGIANVYDKIEQTKQLINTYKDYSYSYSYSLVEGLSEEFDNNLSDLRLNITNLDSQLRDLINDLAQTHTIDINNVLSRIPAYVAGNGIDINSDNTISVKPGDFVDNNSIYVNSNGQLVVNNEVVLANAETKFKFIDENGNWVGDMANVKNYIDNSISTLDNNLNEKIESNTERINNLREDMNTEISNMYTYVTKFTEYDTYGKEYGLSEEFIRSQE